MRKRSSTVSLAAVAKEAGVSPKTVSRVINHEQAVSQLTREIVEEAIEKLGFVPNRTARRLAGKRSYTLALACPGLGWTWLGPTKLAMSERCAELNYTWSETATPHLLKRNEVDGVALMHLFADDDELKAHLEQEGIPFLSVFTGGPVEGEVSLYSDEEQGIMITVEHLLSLGHKRLGFIGPLDEFPGAVARLRGFRKATEHLAEPCQVVGGDLSPLSGYQAGLQLLSGAQRCTAVVCANDETAAGVLRAAHELRLRVPDEVSVTGFDDSRIAEEVTAPPLTSARQPFELLGREIVDQLLECSKSRTRETTIVLPMRLSIRSSTAPPPGR